MVGGRRSSDFRLLDALSDIEGQPLDATVWRVVRKGRSAFDGSRGAGRWNPAHLRVLYTALEADGAKAEIHYHMSRGQSVPPSKIEHTIHEIAVTTKNTLVLTDTTRLKTLGVDEERYRDMLYDRTGEIAEAAAFLGLDGILAPSVRWKCNNLVLFLDVFDLEESREVSRELVDWPSWIAANRH